MIYKVIDLFAGAGGLSLGFKQTGKVEIVATAENNPNARKTYLRNFSIDRLYSDVRLIDFNELTDSVGSVDVVIGGPPCQGFSNANRQHSTVVCMNNSLVKAYVHAIYELRPKAFVMENVSMLRSKVHRFFLEEKDIHDPMIANLDLTEDKLELLPAGVNFNNSIEVLKATLSKGLIWEDWFYKLINLLYRYRINQKKFNTSLEKNKNKLLRQLNKMLQSDAEESLLSELDRADANMARAFIEYLEGGSCFEHVIKKIEVSVLFQRALLKLLELTQNEIHVFEFRVENGTLIAIVKSYSVLDYLRTVFRTGSCGYLINEAIVNSADFGAPQKRERFIIVGIRKDLSQTYKFPEPKFKESEYRTVYDAISDLQEITPATSLTKQSIKLLPKPNAPELIKELRGKFLFNHIVTATRATALERFKALKAGENFHDLSPELKTTYSNVERTQNTIYMRLKYDEASGTVVNVRKSMWIHPVLDRAISIREAARLQTFPDSFVFEGTKDSQYQQVGNAVPPFLAKAIAESLFSLLDKTNF